MDTEYEINEEFKDKYGEENVPVFESPNIVIWKWKGRWIDKGLQKIYLSIDPCVALLAR